MTSPERCPQCNKEPEVYLDKAGKFVLECPQHGYMAMGANIEKATEHWNIFVQYVKKLEAA